MIGSNSLELSETHREGWGRRHINVVYLSAITLVTIAAAALRAVRLDHPVRYDEAFSYLAYATGQGPSVWLAYTYPNNHLFHTLLVHFSTALGGPALAAIRAPAFLAGVGLVPLAAALAHRLSGRKVDALFAALFVSASSILVEYSVNARGYSMVCASTMVMCLATLAINRRPKAWIPWIVWILAAVAGLFTIPVMVYPIGLLSFIIASHAAKRRESGKEELGFLAAALAMTSFMAVLLYLPSIKISGLDAIISNRFVQPIPISEVVHHLPGTVIVTGLHWTRDLGGFALLIVAGLGVSVFLGLRQRDPFLLLPLIAPPLLFAVAATQRVIPFPRVWLFLLPIFLVCAAVGLGYAVTIARKYPVAALCLIVSVFVLAITQGARVLTRDYLISEDSRTLVDAEAIVHDLAPFNESTTALVYDIPSGPSLAYYTILQGRESWINPDQSNITRGFVVVAHGQTIEEVIAAYPNLGPRINTIRRRLRYARAEVWEVVIGEK